IVTSSTFATVIIFDPTDLELLEHLEGKVGRAASHVLINGFIPTIEEAEGICHTHPENLPGVKLNGIAIHFFHKISNAYDVGKRKRRKISHSDHTVCDENLTWHKTGKSRSILDNNGVIKGWKKILVLYIGSRKGGGKAEKTNWRMHQYHLGVDQDEKQEELVVSKVFYQFPSNDVGQPLICSVLSSSPLVARPARRANPVSSSSSSSLVDQTCMCSPTNHLGSFCCPGAAYGLNWTLLALLTRDQPRFVPCGNDRALTRMHRS
ncbi:hypothetical protein ZWY2020_046738, partial [Hordeum vulgare]